METRPIPVDGHRLPVVGLGTWRTFDAGPDAERRSRLNAVLGRFAGIGGGVLDTSPMYGSAEAVAGDLITEAGLRERLFLATKVWTLGRNAGREQVAASFDRLRTPRLDLLQVHNLVDWSIHLPLLRTLKGEGRVRYVGITHYAADAHAEVEEVLRREKLDFLQINYSLAEPEAAARLLPLAADRGVAVIANRPFAEGALFARVRGRPVPAAAADLGCRSWAQLFLRWILAHPAVTCVIPATDRIDHLEDNLAAGLAPPPAHGDQRTLARLLYDV